MSERFSLRDRLSSFIPALAGVRTLLVETHNARLHLLASVLVVSLGFYLEVTRSDWLPLVLVMGMVWLAESLNSALEYLCDAAVPERHPLIRKAKDVAAAGVLISASCAVAVALLVFLPHL